METNKSAESQFLSAFNNFQQTTQCEFKQELGFFERLVDRLYYGNDWVDLGDKDNHYYVTSRDLSTYFDQKTVDQIKEATEPSKVFLKAFDEVAHKKMELEEAKIKVTEVKAKILDACKSLNFETFERLRSENVKEDPAFNFALRQALTSLRDDKNLQNEFQFALRCYYKYIASEDESFNKLKSKLEEGLKTNTIGQVISVLKEVKDARTIDIPVLLEIILIGKSEEEITVIKENLKTVLVQLMEESQYGIVKQIIGALEAITADPLEVVEWFQSIVADYKVKDSKNPDVEKMQDLILDNFKTVAPEKGLRLSTILGMTVVYEDQKGKIQQGESDQKYISKRHYRDLLDHPILMDFTKHNFFIIKKDKTSEKEGGFKIIREAVKVDIAGKDAVKESYIHGRAKKTKELEVKEFEILQTLNPDGDVIGIPSGTKLISYEGKNGKLKCMYVEENLGKDAKEYSSKLQNDEEFFYKVLNNLVNALDYMHNNKGYVHHDLKPENILIDNSDNAVIIDYGLVRKIEEERPYPLYGTPQYSSPELIEGLLSESKQNVDATACDMYALGVSIYQFSFGTLPGWCYDLVSAKEAKDAKEDEKKIHAHLSDALKRQKEIKEYVNDYKSRAKYLSVEEKRYYLMYRLLDPDPQTRLTAAELKKEVQNIREEMQKKKS